MLIASAHLNEGWKWKLLTFQAKFTMTKVEKSIPDHDQRTETEINLTEQVNFPFFPSIESSSFYK